MNKKDAKLVARVRRLIVSERRREACDLYHKEACDILHWKTTELSLLRAARRRRPDARMHGSTRRNLNSALWALRVVQGLVDIENDFCHRDDLGPV